MVKVNLQLFGGRGSSSGGGGGAKSSEGQNEMTPQQVESEFRDLQNQANALRQQEQQRLQSLQTQAMQGSVQISDIGNRMQEIQNWFEDQMKPIRKRANDLTRKYGVSWSI